MEAEVEYHGSKFKSFEKLERVGVVSEGFNAASSMTPKIVGEAGGGAGRPPSSTSTGSTATATWPWRPRSRSFSSSY